MIYRWVNFGMLTAICAGLSILPGQSQAAPPGENYLCDFAQADARVYQDYRWHPKEIPIKVYIPPMPFETQDPGMYVPLVQQAYANWTRVAPALRVQFVDSPAKAQIKVEWREYFPVTEDTWGEALLPTPVAATASGEVVRHRSIMHLAIKAQPGSGMGLGAIPFSQEELMAIATHEAGHSLGMPHSRNPDDLMGSYMSKLTANSHWSITQRDINTLYYLYSLPKKLKSNPCKH